MARDTNRIAAQQGHAKQVSQAAAFLKKSGAKNFCYAGAWALARKTPMPQGYRSFLVLFFKKELLA
jgi:hypothetical protein